MASTSVVKQEGLYDYDGGVTGSIHGDSSAPDFSQQSPPANYESNHLSPFLSRINSDSVSSPVNLTETTPAPSSGGLSHYQPSDFSDLDEDPFFGADFSNVEGATPTFLEDTVDWGQSELQQATSSVDGIAASSTTAATAAASQHHVQGGTPYPLTPDQQVPARNAAGVSNPTATLPSLATSGLPESISPQQLQKPFNGRNAATVPSQLTPSQSSSCQSSEDGLAPAIVAMSTQSPRVTVSLWGKDNDAPVQAVERTFDESPSTVRASLHSAGDLMASNHDAAHDSMGIRQRNPVTGHGGIDPQSRTSEEGPSINEIVADHQRTERSQEVDKWLSGSIAEASVPREKSADEIRAIEESRLDVDDQIPLGDQTENRVIPDQMYYTRGGDEIAPEDISMILSARNFEDAPMLPSISMSSSERHQPPTAAAAMQKFNRMLRDTDSVLSRSATWGTTRTRRRSLPSVLDMGVEEGVTSGSFLKKLSISRGDGGNKSSTLLKDLRGLVRRPSVQGMNPMRRKRSASGQGETLQDERDTQAYTQRDEKRESTPHLSPPSRTSSWGKKNAVPSINTAFLSMGHGIASIGTTHVRSGSVSGPVPQTSPKNTFANTLSVKSPLRRRSKSELPKPTNTTGNSNESHPNIVGMLRKITGGPPVAALNQATVDIDDDDDEDDDLYEDSDMKANPNIIDGITPNFAGFQQHIIALNPMLSESNTYLVERIAHHQIVRYKHLLTSKVKHLNMVGQCSSGSLCVAMGGSANVLDQKGDAKGLDPLSAHLIDDEDDGTPVEGIINQESFPQDIPMPPTQSLPAEFECQLCYQRKKFQKPSDWTKHVHEDVQPFTCTWDKCRDAKMFKRKADWVRHENEGHRHLEWWKCDVEDCQHVCFRRDNFLQHLVREHKFLEPRVKTKAAMKRSGGIDPTWQKVEQCHKETNGRPQEEPCRFCGKSFPTWKKLTVHLAKHMEQISLPVLRLVAAKAKELDADTIISPVQDPPMTRMIPSPTNRSTPSGQYPVNTRGQQLHSGNNMAYAPGQLMYPVIPPDQYQSQFFAPQYNNIGQALRQGPMGNVGHVHQGGYGATAQLHNMPGTTASYDQNTNTYMSMNDNGVEPFPEFNSGAYQDMGDAHLGPQMGYDTNMLDPSNGSPFSGQGSVSPYSHSPHLASGNGNNGWDERASHGFM